jgi:hypothetical protein
MGATLMRLDPFRAARSSFPPFFPLLSGTVISPLFPGIPERFSLAIVTKLAPNRLVTIGA